VKHTNCIVNYVIQHANSNQAYKPPNELITIIYYT